MKRLLALLLCLLMVFATACAADTTADEPTQAPEVTPVEDDAQGEPAGAYTPGTYTATAQGFGGEVTVTITVDAETITDCTAEGPSETSGIGSRAIEQLPGSIVEANSVEVDAIVGCTFTSEAVLQAASEALNQAMGVTAPAEVKMAPGTYTGEAYGFIAIEPLSVSVTVDESSILDIEVDGNRDSVAMVRSVNTYMVPRVQPG